jgi:hypothetical protein
VDEAQGRHASSKATEERGLSRLFTRATPVTSYSSDARSLGSLATSTSVG